MNDSMTPILDSGALIVYLQDECAQLGDASAISRHDTQRKLLLDYLDAPTRKKKTFIVPAVAYVEFLIGIPDKYKMYLAGLPAKFRIAPLSERAAIFAAQMKTELMGTAQIDEIASKYGQGKNVVRGDIYILAICKAEGVNKRLITRDKPLCERAAKLRIPCTHIDDLPKPPNTLFNVLPDSSPLEQP